MKIVLSSSFDVVVGDVHFVFAIRCRLKFKTKQERVNFNFNFLDNLASFHAIHRKNLKLNT